MRWWLLGTIGLAFACGGGEEVPPEPEGHSEHAEHGEEAPGVAAPVALTNARVMFVGLEDGASVTGPLVDGKVSVHVTMGAEGAQVQPAGTLEVGTGHHHIIVDGEGVPFGTAVPADETHIHFGGGQTEADVPLAPGTHTLRLQFADGAHRSYGPELSTQISITVTEAGAADEGEGETAEVVEAEAGEAAE